MYICIFVYLLLGTCILCRRKKCSRRGLVLLRTLRALGSTTNGWPMRQSQNSASPNSASQNSDPASQSPNSAQNDPPPSQTTMKSSAPSLRGSWCGRDTAMTMPRCHVELVDRDVARGHHRQATPGTRADFGARRRAPSRTGVWAWLQSCRGAA